MKRILLLLTLSALAASPVLAQDSGTTPPKDGPGKHGGGPGGGPRLTPEERDELKAAREAAFKANPGLDAEGKDLMAKMEAYKKKVAAAMVKADPKVEPLIAKMEAGRPHGGPGGPGGFGGGPGGPPPPPPSDKD